MKVKRLIKSLSALSLVATLALPLAADATPFVDFGAAPAANHLNSASRSIYYAAKERQLERLDNARLHHPTARRATRHSASTYAAMKDNQMERFLNGE